MQTQHQIWDLIARYLVHIDTDIVFSIPSDDLGFLRALRDHNLRMVVAKDQRNAAFMTAGYALVSRKLGVCAVGKGPALTNTITGLLESTSLAAPVLLIAVGTGRDHIGTHAFQETDQIALVKPVVKWAYRVEHVKRLAWALEKAAFLSVNDCPGPVYIEIPEDLAEEVATPPQGFSSPSVLQNMPSPVELDAALAILTAARRPLLLVGGGALNGRVEGIVEQLAECLSAAIFTTASGRGAVDESHPLYGGVAGLYCAEPLRKLWQDADVVVALGSRMEETATLLLDTSVHKRPVIQVNLRTDHFSHLYQGLLLWGDYAATVRYWMDGVKRAHRREHGDWTQRITSLKRQALQQSNELLGQLAGSNSVHVSEILVGLEKTMPSDSILVQENGLLDMWSYFHPYFSFKPGQLSLVPSEQTSLGFGAAAAIGAKAAMPHRTVVAFVGDGAFNMFRADLVTTIDNCLPVTYVILNNGSFGWLEYQGRSQDLDSSLFHFSWDTHVSHESIVRMEITARGEIEDVLKCAYRHNAEGKTALVDVRISTLEIAPGVEDFYGDPNA